jgi:hypothetical protein
MNRTFIQIVGFRNNEIVKNIDVTGKTEREIEKIENGILINMDTDKFYTKIKVSKNFA